MGIFYIIYKRNVNKGFIKNLCQRNIYKIWSTSENYIGSRPKIYISILGVLHSKTKNINNNINSIPSIDKQINKMVEPDVKTVFISLCQSHIK